MNKPNYRPCRLLLWLTAIIPLLLMACTQNLGAPAAQKVRLRVSVDGGGSVTRLPDGELHDYSALVQLQAVAEPGFVFSRWEGDAEGGNPSLSLVMDGHKQLSAIFTPHEPIRQWTILVYMAGDNDLEAAMMYDLNEMEAAELPAEIEVIALVDRSPHYDNSDGDWRGTRLYRIRPDTSGQNSALVSTRLASPILGLTLDSDTNLNTGSGPVLEGFIRQVQTDWPAENYALVMWGHGTGWRGGQSATETAWKGFAVDDSAGDLMYTAEFARAIQDKQLALVGMDLCYGGLMEIAWEIRSAASWYVASQEAVPANGWNYRDVLNRFAAAEQWRAEDLASAIVDSYAQQYAGQLGAGKTALRLDRIAALNQRLNDFCLALAQALDTSAKRDMVRALLLDEVQAFSPLQLPGDRFIDIGDMARVVAARTAYAGAEASALLAAIDEAVALHWKHPVGNPGASGLSLHLIGLDAFGNLRLDHSPAYYRNAVVLEPLSFVQNSAWVPTQPAGDSLLDVLWYRQY